MDLLIAASQGAGLAVACGLVAILPLGVLALAALAGWTPGALGFATEPAFTAAVWALGLIEAAARAVLPIPIRIAVSATAAAAAFEIAAGRLAEKHVQTLKEMKPGDRAEVEGFHNGGSTLSVIEALKKL